MSTHLHWNDADNGKRSKSETIFLSGHVPNEGNETDSLVKQRVSEELQLVSMSRTCRSPETRYIKRMRQN